MEPTTLTTERLLLRPLDERDVEAVREACQDPEIVRWIPVPDPYRRKDAEDFVFGASRAGWREDTMYNFGVFTKSGGLVGSMGLVRLAQLYTPERQAELGFWTVKEHRGKGYTVEAGRAVIDWAFSALKAERLEWVAQGEPPGIRASAARWTPHAAGREVTHA